MKRLSPASLQYAVIRINPEAMVEHFGDSGATTRARALHAQKYLVYLDLELDLPFPTSEWFRFRVSPIASSLRPEDAERGITSDMVVPIHPNPDRPQGRAPIVTEPPFPFDNCYHWVNNTMAVRVLRKPELYDDTGAVKVSSAEHVRLGMAFWEDCNRIPPASEAVHEDTGPVVQMSRSRPLSQSSEVSSSIVVSSDNELPQMPATGSLPLACQRNRSIEDIMAMDVFNLAHDDSEETMPLVDLWFDLAAHFPDGKIPNSLDLEWERDTIESIVREARRRNPCVPVPQQNRQFLDSGSDRDSESESEEEDLSRTGDGYSSHTDDEGDIVDEAPAAPYASDSSKSEFETDKMRSGASRVLTRLKRLHKASTPKSPFAHVQKPWRRHPLEKFSVFHRRAGIVLKRP